MFSPKAPSTLSTPKYDIIEYLKQAMLTYNKEHELKHSYNDESVRKEFLQFLDKHDLVISNMSAEDKEKLKKKMQACLGHKRKTYCTEMSSNGGYGLSSTHITVTVICIDRVELKALGGDLKKMHKPEKIEKNKPFWKKLVR